MAVIPGGQFTAATVCVALLAAMPAAAGQAPSAQASWRPLVKLAGIVDVVGPRADGRLVVATRAGLYLLRPSGVPEAFARGQGGYAPEGGEPYIALSPDRRVPRAGCAFVRDDIYALDASSSPGVVRIDPSGRAGRFAELPSGAFPSGIAFDNGGAFGYRLLVTTVIGETTTLYAIDCRGRMTPLTRGGPRVEGGIAVAPKSFGKFAGDLLAPDENSGRIFAFGPKGGVAFVVDSRLPAGADIGVEGIGFVPHGLGRGAAAYFADLGAPGSPTEGNDNLLVLRGGDLARARFVAGDLVVATEAGARTLAVRCAVRCTIRQVAAGPTTTHGEGHITFVPGAG